jgi:hypothetical protein
MVSEDPVPHKGQPGGDDSLARSKVLIGVAGAAAQLLEEEREEGWGWEEVAG